MEYLFGLFFIPHVFVIALQIICAVHVIRNRKEYWWLFVIFFFPFVGSVVYFIVEIYPDMKRGRSAWGVQNPALPTKPSRRIKRLEQDIEYADTVRKRTELAEAYLDAGMAEKAREQYRRCLTGIHRDDPNLQYGLARALFAMGSYEEAGQILNSLRETDWRDYRRERALLEARALSEMGRFDQAEPLFQEALAQSPGEEARVRYAEYMLQQGRKDEAAELYRATLAKARIADGAYRSRERVWINRAKSKLNEIGG